MQYKKESTFKFKVHIIPSAHSESIYLREDNIIAVRVNAPPEKGKANTKLLELLSKWLNISKTKIKIIQGETSRDKLLELPEEFKSIFLQKKSELLKLNNQN
ncbi:MAG TPA: DUF167 domain-containing protein [Candidatus Hydrogenedens sp.]|nr:DUF167 domain-containing protein [Candidatus Hydrogenedens sp.]HOK08843.1 DUF167 domain-containing protein [Candidatus Hydrogenedens sp.]HOL18671.1 DUF167 domain-containing protein [Candidatus Hydrogenedens sp.]HPP58532.1 DUF167 domain-containing protein [Candidatus Hydrogenedens sp.]